MNPADTPARPAETDLMARLAAVLREELAANHDGDPKTMRCACADCATDAVSALLRTLAAMAEDSVIEAAAEAGAGALLQNMAESLRLTLQERVAIALRAASPLLLARQAGEMERMREEVAGANAELAHLDAECAKLVEAVGPGTETESAFDVVVREIMQLRAQLRAAEQQIEALRPGRVDPKDMVCIDCDPNHPESEPCRPLARPASPAEPPTPAQRAALDELVALSQEMGLYDPPSASPAEEGPQT